MKRVALLGMIQSSKHTVFQIEKKAKCVDVIRAFLHELGFASWDTARLCGPLGAGDTGKPTVKFKSALYDDKFFALQKGQYNVQVYFGKKKATVSVQHLEDVSEQLKEKILKFCERRETREKA